MTKKTKKADKPSKAGAVELTEERLDAASGGARGPIFKEVFIIGYNAQEPVPPRIS